MTKKLSQLIVMLFVSIAVMAQGDDEVMMTVGDMDVTVGEFKYIYEKNNGDKANYSQQSINEYLNLYKKFKLKVAKAKEQRLDTIQNLKEELNGYKRQLANSYLMDKEIMGFLVDQLYERKQQDVAVSHIFFANPPKRNIGTAADNTEEKANKAYEELKKGTSWTSVVQKYTEDKNTKDNAGELGYYTAMMPNGYSEFEDAMYNLKVGDYSQPIKTPAGYHIIKVTDRRPARGKVEVAQILVKKKGNPAAQGKIKEAYDQMKKGLDWKRAVLNYSDDSKTKTKEGKLPAFGINVYDAAFEDAAFSLEKEGDYTEPIESRIGYHILKLVRKVPLEEKSTFKKVYEAKIKKDSRYEQARKDMILDIKKTANFKLDDKLFNSFVSGLPKDFLNYKWKVDPTDPSMDKVLFSFGGDQKYTLEEFAMFCKKNTKSRLRYNQGDDPIKQVSEKLLNEYVEEKAIEFEQQNLENKYADFRALMREYEEGILLFEATKMAVWDKANQDTVGLQAFYEKNKDRYKTDPKAVLTTVTFIKGEKKTLNKVMKMAKKKDIAAVAKKYNKKEEIFKTKEETLPKNDQKFRGMEWKVGAVSELEMDPKSKNPYFTKITEIVPVRNKTLKEARGYVVSDYQEDLEKQWIDSLKKEFEVSVNDDVIAKLVKK